MVYRLHCRSDLDVVTDSRQFFEHNFIEKKIPIELLYSVSNKTPVLSDQRSPIQAGSNAYEYIIAMFVAKPPMLFYQKKKKIASPCRICY